jgi:hypothetical protein
LTYLEEYRTNPAAAQPYLTLGFHEELLEEKKLVLCRGDMSPQLLSKQVQTNKRTLYYPHKPLNSAQIEILAGR